MWLRTIHYIIVLMLFTRFSSLIIIKRSTNIEH
jgi:hypothetical protein